MARDHVLMYVLSAIVLLNIIAIILLNNRLADEQAPPAAPAAPQPVITPRVAVRTLLLEDKKACPDCFDLREYTAALNDTMNLQVETVPQAALAQFHSSVLPALAFNASIASYPAIIRGWERVGYTVNITDAPYAGEWYMLPTQNAPYLTADGRVHGRVTVTYLTMRSCGECYDVYTLRKSLNDSRITATERTVDVGSAAGKLLVEKYSISAVPTILMDSEASAYKNLQPGWNIVGTVEPDGTYVLRDLQRAQVTYYDLLRKKLMKP